MFEPNPFLALFHQLDGDLQTQRQDVTLLCVRALMDRLVSPPMLDTEAPEIADVDGAERTLIQLVAEEADRLRELIRGPRPR